jgi:hypothetical protein
MDGTFGALLILIKVSMLDLLVGGHLFLQVWGGIGESLELEVLILGQDDEKSGVFFTHLKF